MTWVDSMPTMVDGGKLHVWVPFSPVARSGGRCAGWALTTRFALFLKVLYQRDDLAEMAELFELSDDVIPRMFSTPLGEGLGKVTALMEKQGVRCGVCAKVCNWRAKNGTRRCGGRPPVFPWFEDDDPTNLDLANITPICWGCHQRASKPPIPRVNNRFVARAQ